MTKSAHDSQSRTPSRREIMRPWELVIGSALAAVFAGVIIFAGTRLWEVAVIATIGVFILALLFTAMFVLAAKPSTEELSDLEEQNQPKGH